jgi:hypothetical protein
MAPHVDELQMRAFATIAIRTIRELRRIHSSSSSALILPRPLRETLTCTEVKVVAHVLVNVYAVPWTVVNSYFGPIPRTGGLVDREAAELCRRMYGDGM